METMNSGQGWLAQLWQIVHPSAPPSLQQQEAAVKDREIKEIADQVMQSSKDMNTDVHEMLLGHIRTLSDSLKLFADLGKVGPIAALTNAIGITEIHAARFNELQKTFMNYLALCESEISGFLQTKQYDKALSLLQGLSTIVPDPTYIYLKIAQIEALKGNRQQAISRINELIPQISPSTPQGIMSKAACYSTLTALYSAEGNMEQAYQSALTAVTLYPSSEAYHTELLQVLTDPRVQIETQKQALLPYINAVIDSVTHGHLHVSDEYFQILASILQGAYEKTWDSEFQGIALRALRRMSEYYVEQGNAPMAFALSSTAATLIRFPSTHPLHEMDTAIEQKCQRMPLPEMGAYFSALDSNEMKGGFVRGTHRSIDNHPVDSFDFKLTHTARATLQKRIDVIEANREELAQALPENFCTDVVISDVEYTYRAKRADGTFSEATPENYHIGKAKKIHFVGVGWVIIGCDPQCGSLYNRVQVELEGNLPPGEGVKRLHTMLSMIGITSVAAEQSSWDNERMKILQLLHTFFPREALEIERDAKCLEMSPQTLLAYSVQKIPQARECFEKYLFQSPDLMQKQEILPGCSVWHITDLANQLRNKNAWGFILGVGSCGTTEEASVTVGQMLKVGALSSQTRFDAGLIAQGVSSKTDHMFGSSDSVFTRLITPTVAKAPISEIPFSGQVTILYDLSLINRGGYAYPHDEYGLRNLANKDGHLYRQRADVVQTAQHIEENQANPCLDNEFMFKFAIIPQFVRGLVVKTEQDKTILIQELRKQGLVEDREGVEYLIPAGKPLDSVIHVSTTLTKGMWQ